MWFNQRRYRQSKRRRRTMQGEVILQSDPEGPLYIQSKPRNTPPLFSSAFHSCHVQAIWMQTLELTFNLACIGVCIGEVIRHFSVLFSSALLGTISNCSVTIDGSLPSVQKSLRSTELALREFPSSISLFPCNEVPHLWTCPTGWKENMVLTIVDCCKHISLFSCRV